MFKNIGAVMPSFNTTVRQMIKMSQRKNDRNVSTKKKQLQTKPEVFCVVVMVSKWKI